MTSEAPATTTAVTDPVPPFLQVDGLIKRFGSRTAVDNVSFHIAEGETYGLLGPNGAGKSTTISMICGLAEADAGDVQVGAHRIGTKTTAGRSDIGFVPQEIAVYPDLTARENLKFFGELYGLGRARLRTRVDEVLEVIGLSDRADDRTDDFSGGMKRRLNIGLGLLHSPRLLILDEPTVGVDPQSRNAILGSVEELGQSGLAVLYTTHYMEEAERLCDRVGIIDEGVLIAEGTRRELTDLIGGTDGIAIELDAEGESLIEAIRTVDGVIEAGGHEQHIQVVASSAAHTLPAILRIVGEGGRSPRSVTVTEPDLEAVFLHLTGKALRD